MSSCNECGAKVESLHAGGPRYCPNCGAVPGAFTALRAPPKQAQSASEEAPLLRSSAAEWMRQAASSGQGELGFARALSEVIQLAERLSLPNAVLPKAGTICKRAFADISITRAFSLKVLSAASLYLSSCQLALGVTVNEAAESGKVPRSEVIKCSRKLQKRLRILHPTSSPHECASRVLTSLGVTHDDALAVEAVKMVDMVSNDIIQGRNPSGVACACIYVASKKLGRGITLRRLGRVGYITEATIRNVCSALFTNP